MSLRTGLYAEITRTCVFWRPVRRIQVHRPNPDGSWPHPWTRLATGALTIIAVPPGCHDDITWGYVRYHAQRAVAPCHHLLIRVPRRSVSLRCCHAILVSARHMISACVSVISSRSSPFLGCRSLSIGGSPLMFSPTIRRVVCGSDGRLSPHNTSNSGGRVMASPERWPTSRWPCGLGRIPTPRLVQRVGRSG